MEYGLVSAAYISASVLFILSLGGLSNQEKAKRAVSLSFEKYCSVAKTLEYSTPIKYSVFLNGDEI